MANVSRSVRFKVLERDGFTCRYCGAHGEGVVLHVDHVHPKSRGGVNAVENLVTACFDCNMGKRDWVMSEETVEAMTIPTALPATGKWATLKGKFFHLKGDDGLVHRQGRILGFHGDDDLASIEYFDWFIGHSAGVQLEHLEDLIRKGMYLYKNDEDMRYAWEYFLVPRKNYAPVRDSA